MYWLRFLWRIIFIVLLVISAIWSRVLFDPHLFFMRDYRSLAPLVFLFLLLLSVRWVWLGRQRLMAYVLVVVVSLAVLLQVCNFQYQRYAVLHENSGIEKMLGRHFIVGYTSEDELKQLIEHQLIAGVFITARNIQGKNSQQLGDTVRRIQSWQAAVSGKPLIIATDQEGGIISRLSPPLSLKKPLSSLLLDGRSLESSVQAAYQYGIEQGKELSAVGVTANFAPVVDLKMDHGQNPQDRNSLISQRAISADAHITSQMALAYSQGLQQAGIVPTLKHFPGLGRIKQDTHHADAVMPLDYRQLQQADWLPFREVAQKTNAMIMLAHVVLADIDAENAASFSFKVVHNIIRGQWQHEGVLITDDLTMAAAYDHGLCDVSIKALQAGVDVLLVSFDSDQFYPAMYCVMQAVKQQKIKVNDLHKSERRLLKMTGFARG